MPVMGLRNRDIRAMDVADYQDILERAATWQTLPEERPALRQALIDGLQGKEIHPWYEVILVEAIKDWRGNIMSRISEYLHPDEIEDLYVTLHQLYNDLASLQLSKVECEQRMTTAWATAVTNGDIEPGKNDKIREAQTRKLAVELANQLDDIDVKLTEVQGKIKLTNLKRQHYEMLINYFRTGEVEHE